MGLNLGDHTEILDANRDSRRFRSAQSVMVFVPHGSLNDEDQMANLKV